MRGTRIHTRASRRVNDHRSTATDEFDHSLLADGVYESVIQDMQLKQIEDAIATAEDARDTRRDELDTDGDDDPAAEIASSLSPLQETARQRVLELCAQECRFVLETAEGEEVRAEAVAWLEEHPETADRLWGIDPEADGNWVSDA